MNWSAVAARAFEQKLAEIITRKGVKAMEDVVARLRVSKAKQEDGLFRTGFADGQEWAKGSAEVAELQRLESLRDRLTNQWDDYFDANTIDSHNIYTASEMLAHVIQDDDADGDEESAKEFWRAIGYPSPLDPPVNSEKFARGFAEGALQVWEEVKEKL